LRKESYDVGDKWYYQQDNELYTSAGMLSIYRAVLSVDKKKKLAMDLNRFSVNFICMFTQIMWFYVMGLTSVSNKKRDYLWSKN
jgi:hypothetical protein